MRQVISTHEVKRFTIRIGADLARELDEVAASRDMTRSALIQDVLYKAVGRGGRGAGEVQRTAVASWAGYTSPGQANECSCCGIGLPSSEVAFLQLYSDGQIEPCCWVCANRTAEGKSNAVPPKMAEAIGKAW